MPASAAAAEAARAAGVEEVFALEALLAEWEPLCARPATRAPSPC